MDMASGGAPLVAVDALMAETHGVVVQAARKNASENDKRDE